MESLAKIIQLNAKSWHMLEFYRKNFPIKYPHLLRHDLALTHLIFGNKSKSSWNKILFFVHVRNESDNY